MILFTKIEVRIPNKEEKGEEDELTHLQRSVLRDLRGEEENNEIEDKDYTIGLADAIVDTDNNLLFYEYDGVTIVEELTGSPVVLAHGLEPIRAAFEQQLSNSHSRFGEEEEEDFEFEPEEIDLEDVDLDTEEAEAIESLKQYYNILRQEQKGD